MSKANGSRGSGGLLSAPPMTPLPLMQMFSIIMVQFCEAINGKQSFHLSHNVNPFLTILYFYVTVSLSVSLLWSRIAWMCLSFLSCDPSTFGFFALYVQCDSTFNHKYIAIDCLY